VPEAGALLNGFVAGGAVGAGELVEMPKLNGVALATGLVEGILVGLLVIPKSNFGFDASPLPPAGRAPVRGLVLISVDVGGLGFCGNEKIP
jgi:hypothetical protein